ncbi:MAG: ribosome-associated translation inhibitor RaiA [Bacilli bacterium]|nr:ribosome-associated translation inhibitor RaiA [Bacilli bacterium]
MNINIRGDKIEVTSSIKKYIKEKLSRLDKYFENTANIDAHVLIRARNGEQVIEVTIPTSRYTLRAEEKNSDLYAAIDLVIDVLERQIRKNKTKLNKRREVNQDFAFIPEDEEEYEDDNMIVKRKMVSAKPMSEEEAILQMELLDHDFFMFKNEDEDCFSVLYRRKDGNYGIISSK